MAIQEQIATLQKLLVLAESYYIIFDVELVQEELWLGPLERNHSGVLTISYLRHTRNVWELVGGRTIYDTFHLIWCV